MRRTKQLCLPGLLLIILGLAGPLLAQKSDLETQLVNTERQLWEAWKNKDATTFEKTLHPDAVTVSSKGVEDRTASIKDIAGGNCQVTSYILANTKVTQIDKDTVLLTYKANQDAVCDGQKIPAAVYASSIYEKKDGKWLPVFHQETPVSESTAGGTRQPGAK